MLLLLLSGGVALAEVSEAGGLEKRLHKYLQGRLLVFREPNVGGSVVRFDSRGQLLRGTKDERRSGRTGILYLNLELKRERLLLRGEPVGIDIRAGDYRTVRDPRKLQITTCSIVLDVPLEQLTFEQAVRILARVFLTKPEFDLMIRRGRRSQLEN